MINMSAKITGNKKALCILFAFTLVLCTAFAFKPDVDAAGDDFKSNINIESKSNELVGEVTGPTINENYCPTTEPNGTCGTNLTWKLSSDGILTISGTGKMTDYSYSSAPWYSLRESIKSAIITDGITGIGNYSFCGCTNLLNVNISNSVTSIGDDAFSGCTSISNLNIPNSVTDIGERAFNSCKKLAEIVIPENVTSIGTATFCNCTNLTSITVNGKNTNYCDDDGVLFDKDKTTIICFPVGKAATSYTIPNSVKCIGERSFYGCSKLVNLGIPESVTEIGRWAFRKCTGITDITIPKGVKIIDVGTFLQCSNLENITTSDGITSIGIDAFNSCSNLKSLNIPNSVTEIGEAAFLDCTSLESITIPDSVVTIGLSAFEDCTNLKDIYYKGTESDRKNIAINSYNDPLKNATWHCHMHDYTISYEWSADYSSCTAVAICGSDNSHIATETAKITAVIMIPSTCTSIGTTKYTASFISDAFTTQVVSIDDVPIKNHTIVIDKAIAATCTESGLTEGLHCSVCNKIIVPQEEIPAKGHSALEAVAENKKEPTCVINGCYDSVIYCADCSAEISREKISIPAIGHSFGNTFKENEIEPLCTKSGSYDIVTYCSECGTKLKTETVIIKATGHVDEDENGYCDVCGEITDVNVNYANSCKNAVINVAAVQTVDYKSNIIIKATAADVGSNCYLAIYIGNKQVAKGTNTEVSYTVNQVTSDINYTVKVVDASGNVQKDGSDNELTKGGTIICNSNIIAIIIAFFKGLFGLLPTVTIKP